MDDGWRAIAGTGAGFSSWVCRCRVFRTRWLLDWVLVVGSSGRLSLIIILPPGEFVKGVCLGYLLGNRLGIWDNDGLGGNSCSEYEARVWAWVTGSPGGADATTNGERTDE